MFVRNCDGSSFTSSRPGIFTGADDGDDDDDNDGLYMQGKQILDGVVSDLLFNKHLGHAREVVIAGCSAGGLAVMIHADSIAERIRGNALNLRRPDAADIKVTIAVLALPTSMDILLGLVHSLPSARNITLLRILRGIEAIGGVILQPIEVSAEETPSPHLPLDSDPRAGGLRVFSGRELRRWRPGLPRAHGMAV